MPSSIVVLFDGRDDNPETETRKSIIKKMKAALVLPTPAVVYVDDARHNKLVSRFVRWVGNFLGLSNKWAFQSAYEDLFNAICSMETLNSPHEDSFELHFVGYGTGAALALDFANRYQQLLTSNDYALRCMLGNKFNRVRIAGVYLIDMVKDEMKPWIHELFGIETLPLQLHTPVDIETYHVLAFDECRTHFTPEPINLTPKSMEIWDCGTHETLGYQAPDSNDFILRKMKKNGLLFTHEFFCGEPVECKAVNRGKARPMTVMENNKPTALLPLVTQRLYDAKPKAIALRGVQVQVELNTDSSAVYSNSDGSATYAPYAAAKGQGARCQESQLASIASTVSTVSVDVRYR